jgi:hypothetical protein
MSTRWFALFLAAVLAWTSFTTFEAKAGTSYPAPVTMQFGDPADTSGTVNDHHLDDLGGSTHDLPDHLMGHSSVASGRAPAAGRMRAYAFCIPAPYLSEPERPPCC